MKYKTFKDFLKSKHADQYHGIDDDMPDDFQKWFYDIKIYNIVGYADEYAALQKQEIVEEIERLQNEFVDHIETEFTKGWSSALEEAKVKILLTP